MREFGVAQQRLGRNAADIEAHPAPVLGLDDCGVQSELGGANGRDISARAGSKNDDVIVVAHALPLPYVVFGHPPAHPPKITP